MCLKPKVTSLFVYDYGAGCYSHTGRDRYLYRCRTCSNNCTWRISTETLAHVICPGDFGIISRRELCQEGHGYEVRLGWSYHVRRCLRVLIVRGAEIPHVLDD